MSTARKGALSDGYSELVIVQGNIKLLRGPGANKANHLSAQTFITVDKVACCFTADESMSLLLFSPNGVALQEHGQFFQCLSFFGAINLSK